MVTAPDASRVFQEDLLKEQVAFVTGGGTGIGKEIARTLGRHGARLAIASRKRESLELAARELESEGLECFVDTCDVREPEEVERVVAGILAHYGRLDVLVNNAAGNFPASVRNISYNGFKSIVGIDLIGTYNVTKAVFEARLKDHGGKVVNISAPFSGMGVALQAHVAAAKMGVDALTRSCAVEWAPLGIRVNGVAPGQVADTEGVARFEAATGGAATGGPIVGTKQDIANAVLFLVSDAARFVSGQVFSVDGAASIDMLKIPVEPPG
ncbi:MAG: dehydrogenase [Deltaproteobacteria bacterium]|jgi:peroxisomal 2,4-dienoyl-CoA reductase|nr:dehydrogenase [Deltaproteobacteria bacterium]